MKKTAFLILLSLISGFVFSQEHSSAYTQVILLMSTELNYEYVPETEKLDEGNNGVEIQTVGIKDQSSSASYTPILILNSKPIAVEDLEEYAWDGLEVVRILKEPKSTALYGARGKNGVIILKTK